LNWLKVIKAIACRICGCQKQSLPLSTSTGQITMEELWQLLYQRFPEMGALYLSDKVYRLCNLQDIREFLHQDATNHYLYQGEKFNCDDFSYRLMGQFSVPGWSDLAFGIVWSQLHALNIMVGVDKQVYFIEPQLDKLVLELEPWMGNEIRFIMI